MSFGMLYNQTIPVTCNYGSLSAAQVSWTSIKCKNLVSSSMIAQMMFFSEAERGNTIIKSIEIDPTPMWEFFRVSIHLLGDDGLPSPF